MSAPALAPPSVAADAHNDDEEDGDGVTDANSNKLSDDEVGGGAMGKDKPPCMQEQMTATPGLHPHGKQGGPPDLALTLARCRRTPA